MKNFYLFFFLITGLTLVPVYGKTADSVMYLRSDTKTKNGIVVESNLLIVPADNDFRIKRFNRYTITGQAEYNSKTDILSAAKHNAFINLLLTKGVKSIKSRSELNNSIEYGESVLSYEGFILSSYEITRQKYNENKSRLVIEMDVSFAPVAYPSEWSYYYFKKRLYGIVKDMVSVFK